MKNSKFDQLFNEVVKNYFNKQTKLIKEDKIDPMIDAKWHYIINKDTLQIGFTTNIANVESLVAFTKVLHESLNALQKLANDIDLFTSGKGDIMSINGDEESQGTFIQIIDKNTLKIGFMFGLPKDIDLWYLKNWLRQHYQAVQGF